MALSRLSNLQNDPTFSKIYVDPNNFDATDSIENRGTSPNRPFFSIARAAIEAAMSSYVRGRNNDRNDRTTIIVSPGTHYIDNRPGFSIQDISNSAVFKRRTGKDTWTTDTLSPLSITSNFDIFDVNNDLYKYNSINGGIILPRGTSIVGQDLRKTKIRPLYVPDPLDPDVERSSILNVTGSCYFSTFTFFDADVTKFSYKNYTNSKHVPKYSHHKLTTFVYADGVTKVRLGLEQTDLTDLEMYYYKISHAYNSLSGRDIPDYPVSLDFEPSIDEFRIVGASQENPLGISSIRAGNGDGTGDTSILTITTANLQTKVETPHNFAVDTPVIIAGITVDPNSYNGSFTVREVVGLSTFTVITSVTPSSTTLPQALTFDNATVSVESDTVSSASPYIFNCSLRSVYGMCGMWADGAKAEGFKSMVVAQYTGISLQKDDDAYLIYDDKTFYESNDLKNNPNKSNLLPLHQNSRAIYKPEFENFHIRASSDAFIQCVSIFAIGYAKHFVTESGADMSITNSNSNFGANALNSVGFRKLSFDRDDVGYITHIIPPKELSSTETEINWLPIDVEKIKTVGAASSTRLYINGFNSLETAPDAKIEDYRIGARVNDKLYLNLDENGIRNTYSASICMTIPSGISDIVSKKEYKVSRTGNINQISGNVITLTEPHQLHNGESIRIFADNGQAPDGLEVNKVYYVITNVGDNTLSTSQIKFASTLSDATALTSISLTGIENNGGILTVVSSITDKKSGELGHPIQWDNVNNQWYLNVNESNEIFNKRNEISNPTPTTFIRRIEDDRVLDDRIYKFRYVIPKEFEDVRPPQVGFIIEESKNVAPFDEASSLVDSTQFRNERIITNATTSSVVNGSQTVTITTELPHKLIPGDIVKVENIISSNNPSGVGIISTYNGEYEVLSIPSSKQFTYRLEDVKINPGTFTNAINERDTSQERRALPLVSRNSYKNKFYIYGIDTIQNHLPGTNGKDGIYHLKVLSASVDISSNVGYGLSQKSFRQDVRNLYPQVDRDNANSNPNSAISYADLINVGRVITDDKRKSITFETVNEFNLNNRIGFGITNLVISGAGNTTVTLFTDVEHKLNSIKSFTGISAGNNYTNGTFYSRILTDADGSTEDATCIYTASGGQVLFNTVKLIDVGAAHTVGQRLGIIGPGATQFAQIEVTEINNHIGSGLELFNFQTTNINGIYEIISVPTETSVVIHVPSGITTYTPNTSSKTPIGYLASNGVSISSIELSNLQTGIATVTTTTSHGLVTGNKFKFINSNLSFYNKDFIVDQVVGINTFTFNVGIATTTQTPTTGKILKYGISSNGLSLETGENNLLSRGCFIYAGITTTLSNTLNITQSSISVPNANGFRKGDFILINSEILRVSVDPANNSTSITVLRSQLGTSKTTAATGTVVRKIRVIPTEVRRPSYMRASGHTFEYLGFGPGNYSTALPQRQDRILSEDEILVSQAKRESGGIVVYTGMNDLGEFFTGSKKSSTITNRETTIDAPIITFTGDDVDGELGDSTSGTFDDIIVRNKILIEGSGSQFYGSVEFRNRLKNISDQGILTKNLYFESRDTSTTNKLISVGSTPTSIQIPNPGDISILNEPLNYLGHTYKDNSWRPWGLVSIVPNELNLRIDKLGIGRSVENPYVLDVIGETRLDELEVTGSAAFNSNVDFKDVTFSNVTIGGTATFTGTNFTQIHNQGISKLFNLEVVGVSTFTGISTFNSRVDIDNLLVKKNIKIGVANSNTISAENGNLILSSNSGVVNVNRDLSVTSNQVSITTTRASGVATAFITDSRALRLGVGNTNQSSYIDLNNDSRVFGDYGLRIIRNSGIGSQSSSILHRGNQPLTINAIDSGADVKIVTSNIDRLVVSSGGTVTYTQNNAGQELKGAHFRISQKGTGDAALSWDCAELNGSPTFRWYAGIDASDGYSWKLANPTDNTPYYNEDYNIDYKLKIARDSTLTLFNEIPANPDKTLTLNQTQLTTSESSFDLINTNATTVNAFGAATSLNLGSNTGTATIRNSTLVGTQTTQNLYNTIATTVNAFGAATSLNLGSNTGTATIRNSTVTLPNATTVNVNGVNPTISGSSTGTLTLFNTNLTTVNAFGAATSLNLGSNTGTATIRNSTVTLPNATTVNVNGVNPTISGSSTGTLTLFNTNLTTVNAFGAATSLNLGSNTGTATIRNSTSVFSGGRLGVKVSPGTGVGFGQRNAIIAIGDNDTGIAQNGDGELELWSNNSERVNISSNVDILTSLRIIDSSNNEKFSVDTTGRVKTYNDIRLEGANSLYVSFYDTTSLARDCSLHLNNNTFYILRDNELGSWDTINYPLRINLTNLSSTFGGKVTATQFSGDLEHTLTLNTSGIGITGSATYNNSGAVTFTVTSNATSANESGKIVSRNNSGGGFSAGNITANGVNLGIVTTGFYGDANNLAVRTPAAGNEGAFFIQSNSGGSTFASFNKDVASFNTKINITDSVNIFKSTGDAVGSINFNGINGNIINFKTNGVAQPLTGITRSLGTKIVLYSQIGNNSVDYAFGIENNNLWSSVPSSAQGFKWYAGTTNIATLSGAGNLTISGDITGRLTKTVTGTDSTELIRATMANSDFFRILVGGTDSNAGYVEIATADDGNEPIYVRQYNGVFSNITRTATLLDGSGNTIFPGTVTANGVNLGNGVATGFYGDVSNLAVRTPANNGTFFIQSNSGASTYATFQSGNVNINGTLNVNTGSVTTGDALVIQNGGDLLLYSSSNAGNIRLWCDTNGTLGLSGNIVASGDITAYRTSATNTGVIYLNQSQNRYLYYDGTSYQMPSANLVVGGTVTANSDIKLKTNIKTIDNALNKVCELRGVEFDRKDTGEHQIGVIAQEVEKVIPELVYGDETKSVAYGNMVGVLIEAIKELKEQNEYLKNEIQELKNK